MKKTDKIYRISPGENNELNIVDVGNEFNEFEDKFFLDGKLIGKGRHGEVYKCGSYVKKIFFERGSVFEIEEIAREALYFCFAHQFRIYLRFSGREWYMYFPRAGKFTIADLIDKSKYKIFDLIFPDYQDLFEKVETLHKKGIYHLDVRAPNVVSDFERKFRLIDFGLSLTKQSQYPKGSRFFATPLMAYLESILIKNPSNIPKNYLPTLENNCRNFQNRFEELIFEDQMGKPNQELKVLFQETADYYGLSTIATEIYWCLRANDFYLKDIYPEYKKIKISDPNNRIIQSLLQIERPPKNSSRDLIIKNTLLQWKDIFQKNFQDIASIAHNIHTAIMENCTSTETAKN